MHGTHLGVLRRIRISLVALLKQPSQLAVDIPKQRQLVRGVLHGRMQANTENLALARTILVLLIRARIYIRVFCCDFLAHFPSGIQKFLTYFPE